MPPQLHEHAVVALLRQCFKVPECQSLQHRSASLFRNWGSSNDNNILSSATRQPLDGNKVAKFQRLQDQPTLSCYVQPKLELNTRTSVVDIRQSSTTVHATAQDHAHNGSRLQDHEQENIAIIGGGISGLSCAHYLARESPNAQITIFEEGTELGGWLRSKTMNVDNGTIVFEGGPRTLRPGTPAGMVTLEMISELGLQDELLITPKMSPAAQNRFLYYPNHLVRMPGPGQDLYSMVWGLLTEPVYKGLLPGAIFEYSRPPRPEGLEDESIGSFLERRLGSPGPGNNIVSAVLHGIYAGDIYQLSAKSLMSQLWYYEGSHGSFSSAFYSAAREQSKWVPLRDVNLMSEIRSRANTELYEQMKDASVYTFKGGIGALSAALEKSLRAKNNVTFRMTERVKTLKYDDKSDTVKVTSAQNQPPSQYTQVIATIPGQALATLVEGSLESLASIHAVTVMVINFFYNDPNILPERGFGYLIPRSISFDQNPECALGVVFDSDSTVGQDSAIGTKLTVMLGGHWWDGFDSYPDEDQGIEMAKQVLRRHIGIEEQPVAVNVTLQKACIPQYTVGHESRLKAAHEDLYSNFKGRLTVTGNTYTGVGLNDCVRAARDAVMDVRTGKRTTGLEQFVRPMAWAQTKLASSPAILSAAQKKE